MTSENSALRNCFNEDEEDLNTACNRWFFILNSIIKKCFRKIRIKKQKMNNDDELDKLFGKKRQYEEDLDEKKEELILNEM